MLSQLFSVCRSTMKLPMAVGLIVAASCCSLSPLLAAERSSERPDPVPKVEALPEAEVAAEVDRLLTEEVFGEETSLAELTDDVNFLRRASLDLIGQLPTAEAITAFALDGSPEKRAQVVSELLNDERFGKNWGNYWRDVVMYRRNDERALLAARSFATYMAEQLNEDTPWDEISRELVTALGEVSQEGATGLIAGQWGEVPDTAAEVSRILMGIQIQCAQCHDHPTDRWEREQFHTFAAFFPRISIRRERGENGKRLGFQLVSREQERNRPVPGNPKKKVKKKVGPEHYMPDLADPSSRGTLMEPEFFVTGQTLDPGLTDQQRRERLARWITSRNNPWFAKAYVNRVWAELVGEGFYEPVDDIGPDRDCSAPQAMDLLAEQFVAHAYDTKWLYATILQTDTYQRASQHRRNYEGTPFAANCPQPLRSDQLFNALNAALEMPEPPAPPRGRAARYAQGPRAEMARVFGYDPSDPRDEISGAIDQALMLMNAPDLDKSLKAKNGQTMLGRMLAETDDDEAVVFELYLRCLAREPKDAEIDTCIEYVGQVDDRAEAFEDILWALINSTEFLYRD